MKQMLTEIEQEDRASTGPTRAQYYKRVLKYLEDDLATGMTLAQLIKAYDFPDNRDKILNIVETQRPDYFAEFVKWYDKQTEDEAAFQVAEQVMRQKGKGKR